MKIYKVDSFGQYISTVGEIAKDTSGILWFRGISDGRFPLIPSLYRVDELLKPDFDSRGYTKIHYAEDMRTQHYIAKNYHFYEKLPSSRVEWLEVMQHHLTKTRVLDWSESSIHSATFAVEAFIDTKKYSAQDRKKQAPSVWVLNPQKLNQKIFNFILDSSAFRRRFCEELDLDEEEKKALNIQLNSFASVYNDAREMDSMRHLSSIVNLSSINDEILRDRSRLKYMLLHGEIQPMFYMLSRIYSDGVFLYNRVLPPLAVVQSYHSERIKAQKGVFVVFPVYREKNNDGELRKIGFDPNAMQNNPMVSDCLYRIDLLDPENIANELLRNGVRDSWLYPENPIVSNEIEYCGF